MGMVASGVASSSLHCPSSFSTLGSTRGGSVGILTYHSISVVLHLGKSTTFGSPGIEYIQTSLDVSPGLVPLVLSKFLAEHVMGQFRLLILVASCWMEASWLPTVLNMLEDIPLHCLVIKDLTMDVLVGQVLKDLPYLHLTLWLFRDMCCTDKGSLPQSQSGSGLGGNLSVYSEYLPEMLERMDRLVCLRGWTKQCHICLKLADFLVYLFRVGLAWHTIGSCCSAISVFLEPYHIIKLSIIPSSLN